MRLTLPKGGTLLTVFFVFLPILALVVDILLHPLLLHTHRAVDAVSLVSLLSNQPRLLGTYRAHRLHASVDDLADAEPLEYLTPGGNALVTSAFLSEGEVSVAALGNVVLERLGTVSPQDRQHILDTLAQKTSQRTGEVMKFHLRVPADKYRDFPIDYLYMVLFEEGQPVDAAILKAGLPAALSLARKDGVTTLVLPCLGSTWENKNTISLDDFFAVFFNTLPDGDSPRDIYISLYREWPSFELEDAVRAMNTSWQTSLRALDEPRPAIYRLELRSTLIFWSVCLCVCSFYTPLSLRNFLIISGSFLGLGIGSNQVVKLFSNAYPSLGPTLSIVALAVFAFGFPFIVKWNPKDIFSK